MSPEYKRDFIRLQVSFARMFDSVCETVKSQVPVDDLKRYLCRTFSEFQILLRDAVTTDDVMKAVRNESSLTDFAYFEEIAEHFNLRQVKRNIRTYHSILDSFCEHTLNNHSYVRAFREDYPRYIQSFDKIVFQLEWKANNHTLKDIRDVLLMRFMKEAVRVQIVVIADGSVENLSSPSLASLQSSCDIPLGQDTQLHIPYEQEEPLEKKVCMMVCQSID